MLRTHINCILIGDNFDPYKLERDTNLKLLNKVKKGELGKLGRFKDQKIPYSSAELKIEEDDKREQLDVALDLLAESYSYLRDIDILLTLNIEYEDQCNWEFDPEQLGKIADMNIKFSISCYKKQLV